MRPYLCYSIVDELMEGVSPKDLSIQVIVDRVAIARGRDIVVFGMPLEALGMEKYACWIQDDTYDYICAEWNTAPVHRNHCIIHELSHMLLGHRTLHLRDFHSWLENPILMRGIEYEDREEREAEALAVGIQQFVIRRVGVGALQVEWTTVAEWDELVIRSLQR
jgi:Zn-dependent peptidase ImmA (M78 family)